MGLAIRSLTSRYRYHHVLLARVVVATLGVVVVRDDRGPHAGRRPKQIEARQPFRVGADLVDLVDRDGHHAGGQRRRAGHRHHAAMCQFGGECPRDGAAGPVAQGIAGTARSGEHVASLAEAGQGGRGGERVDGARSVRRTVIGRPILPAKYSTILALMSSAFSWKPYGVSMTVAVTGLDPNSNRSNSARWTRPMVAAVSPEPMIVRTRGSLISRWYDRGPG